MILFDKNTVLIYLTRTAWMKYMFANIYLFSGLFSLWSCCDLLIVDIFINNIISLILWCMCKSLLILLFNNEETTWWHTSDSLILISCYPKYILLWIIFYKHSNTFYLVRSPRVVKMVIIERYNNKNIGFVWASIISYLLEAIYKLTLTYG